MNIWTIWTIEFWVHLLFGLMHTRPNPLLQHFFISVQSPSFTHSTMPIPNVSSGTSGQSPYFLNLVAVDIPISLETSHNMKRYSLCGWHCTFLLITIFYLSQALIIKLARGYCKYVSQPEEFIDFRRKHQGWGYVMHAKGHYGVFVCLTHL